MKTPSDILQQIIFFAQGDGFTGRQQVAENVQFAVSLSVSSCVSSHEITAIKNEINRFALEYSLTIDLQEVGSLGVFSFEPVISVQLKGKARLFYGPVSSDAVYGLLEAVHSRWVHHPILLGQIVSEEDEPWDKVPFINFFPWYASESRFQTEHIGKFNLSSIESAAGLGKFSAFVYVLKNYSQEQIIDLLKDSELRGRSGSGFFTWRKWFEVKQHPSEQKYLVCNAFGSNPMSYSSRHLLEGDPYLVLESVAIAAYAVGCRKAYIVLPYHEELAVKRLSNALEEMNNIGLLGYDILKSGFSLNIQLFQAPGAFISGEETAIISSIEGEKALPKEKPPYPSQSGLFGKPTLVNNVETLVLACQIIRYGVQWFKSIGVEKNYGTKLFSVSGKSVLHGVYELPLGITLEELWNKVKTDETKLKAVYLGGPIGRIFPASKIKEIVLAYSEQDHYFLGDGTVVFLDHSICIVDFLKQELDFIRHENCGKCLPCRNGSNRLWNIFKSLTECPDERKSVDTLLRIKEVVRVKEIAQTIENTALCGLGKRFPQLIIDVLTNFKDEVEEHLYERYCKASVCHNIRSYYIDVNLCTGCGLCKQRCPHNAIIGVMHHPHFIVSDRCVVCGICEQTCKFSAIKFK